MIGVSALNMCVNALGMVYQGLKGVKRVVDWLRGWRRRRVQKYSGQLQCN